ncbi:hypothetical protein ACFYNL_26750 [Streptomyces sp. NPDC007808]|uniref:hypothetical protein n=1 Tax=Streptomyces sp. NPDC007808 TaxID=3364779 RepID=UPI0036C4D79C
MTRPGPADRPLPVKRRTPVNRGVAIAAGALLWAVGWLFVVLALQAGHEAADAEYTGTPVCDGQFMRPGDSCMVFGNGAGESGTYEEIVADNERDAKAEAWAWAEVEGGIGAALVLFGACAFGSGGRLRARISAWVFTLAAVVPLLGVAALVWWLQSRANAASPVPVGIGGMILTEMPDVSYSAWLTALAVAIVALGYLTHLFDTGTPATTAPGRQNAGSRPASSTWGGSVPTQTYRKEAEQEERLKALVARQKEASAAFDKGETDDRWAADRVSLDPLSQARFAERGPRTTRALGAAVYLVACALGIGHAALGITMPLQAAPALAALAGWAVFTARGVRSLPAGAVARPYGAFASLSLVAAVATALSLPAVTWSGLLNTVAFTCGFLTLAVWFGQSLPRPPVAGRIICSLNGAVQLLATAALVVAARAPGSRGLPELLAYAVAALFALSGWISYGTATKTESRGAVPARVCASCLAASALALAGLASWVVLADLGPLGWVVAAGYALAALTQARGAFQRLRGGVRTAEDRRTAPR